MTGGHSPARQQDKKLRATLGLVCGRSSAPGAGALEMGTKCRASPPRVPVQEAHTCPALGVRDAPLHAYEDADAECLCALGPRV